MRYYACLAPPTPTPDPQSGPWRRRGEAVMVALSGRAIGFRQNCLTVWANRAKEMLMDAPLGQKGWGWGWLSNDQAPR